ncbi:MAG: neutral zinc metallopeptidase [Chitinophagales bacterium]|jgi:predicted metalloprotease|nr:zinc metallopeptidase [Sphingobacteriales bacterium]
MEWQGNRESSNVEDRRGGGGRKIAGGIGVGTIIIAVIVFFLGGDPTQVLQIGSGNHTSDYEEAPRNANGIKDEGWDFASTILASTEDVWNLEFQKMGMQYQEPRLVLFSGQTVSDCGGAHSASGPFYCPADKQVYLDLTFFNELNRRFGVEGNFAPAYVIAHEVGHHIQDLMGITTKVHRMRQQVSEVEGNRLSVMLELQADFLAGYWARRAQNLKLTESDIRSALDAAHAIGDDKLQKESQGYIIPDAFTHGTSEQRMEWFMRGFKAKSIEEGNTFKQLGS